MEILHSVAATGGPYVSYGIGVFLADTLSLYPGLSRRQIYLLAIPVGLVTVSTMLMGVTVTVEQRTDAGTTILQKYYGHAESVPEYLLFMGTIMFIGTLVPDIFDTVRDRLRREIESDKTGSP